MKYKSYKDSNEQLTTGLNTELLEQSDILSARSINRPIINLEENQETDYNLLQTLLKTVYGDRNGILPDILEEFIPETFQIGSFKNDESNYYLRLPLGAMFLSKHPGDEFNINDRNPFSTQGEYNYKDGYGKDSFLKDKLHSYVIENKPEINLFERQLASFIGLDLTYLNNDIKIYQDMVPFVIKVAVIDEDTKQIKLKSDGSPMYVQEDFAEETSNIIYLAKEGEGDLEIYYGDRDHPAETSDYSFTTKYDYSLNSVTPSLDNDVILKYVNYAENLTVLKTVGGRFTTDINKAVTLKDSNGETKYRSGYYFNVVRSTDNKDEITWLPNKADNAHFEIFIPSYNGSEIINVDIESNDGSKKYSFYYKTEGEISEREANENLYKEANEKLDKNFIVEKIQKTLRNTSNNEDEVHIGVKISFKSTNIETNNYNISIYYGNEEEKVPLTDIITREQITNIPVINISNQKYYDNIFELTNSFFGNFQSYLTNISSIYDYANFETIIPILTGYSFVYVYYDLEGDVNNQIESNYDKTGRFLVSNNELNEERYIKLFKVSYEKSDVAPYPVKIKYVESYIKNLDRRTISTKRAELSSLLVNSRTELKNYFLLRDNDGNRTVELIENFDDPNKEQMRYASPITRITDRIEVDAISEPDENTWEDSSNGDTPSDFYEDAYYVRDFYTDKVSYRHHNDESNKGIIIDRNKGLRIFNNSGLIGAPYCYGDIDKDLNRNEVQTRYSKFTSEFDGLLSEAFRNKIDNLKEISKTYSSYSEYQPLEIISTFGNINILTSSYDKARINIRNLKDSDNNMIDLLGRTRIRSRRMHPLVVRKISDDMTISSTIAFTTGNSLSKDDEDTLNTEQNTLVGYLDFTSGANKIVNNRTFSLFITPPGTSGSYINNFGVKQYYQYKAFSVRNTFAEGNYFTLTMNGDIVPNKKSNLLGYPTESRTYSEINYIPYKKYLLDEGVNIDNNGSLVNDRASVEENRWLAAFVKYGYFGKINLADEVGDIVNNDARDGVLRLGNSNIFDISSIYINKTTGRLNFDNSIRDDSENTIQSWYEEGNSKNRNGFSFVLNRTLRNFDKPTYTKENNVNFNGLYLSPFGAFINKNLEVTRQAFINNHPASSKDDNSALVVKGQTVSIGDLIIDKNDSKGNGDINNTALNDISRDTDDLYKYYDFEFFEKHIDDGDYYANRAYDTSTKKYLAPNKNNNLFTFVNKGKTLLDGNVKINGVIETNSVFNKTVTINNNRVANYKYNELTTNIPTKEAECFKIDSIDPNDNYYNSNAYLPRNNTSLKVVSGRIVFGSDYRKANGNKDASDIILNGSQFIRRRLEISEEDGLLLNSRKVYGKLLNKFYISDGNRYNASEEEDDEVSPYLFVNGASHFSGDVVFGHKIYHKDDYYYLPNQKIDNLNSNYRPVKTIFWGANEGEVLKNGARDWRSDFDFHGKTWFDNSVEIGTQISKDVRSIDSNEFDNSETGTLAIYGKDALSKKLIHSLYVEGAVKMLNGEEFNINYEDVLIKAQKGENKFASIHMNGEDENFELAAIHGNKTAVFNSEKIKIQDSTAMPIIIESGVSEEIKDANDEVIGEKALGSKFKLNDKNASLEAVDNIDTLTTKTTSISNKHTMVAGLHNGKDVFISDITDGDKNSRISQDNENANIETTNSVYIKTIDYELNASKAMSNGVLTQGSIKETTKNKDVNVSDNYTEKDTNYKNLSSTSWETEIKAGKEDTVLKSIKGNSTSWQATHGTANSSMNSSKIDFKNPNTSFELVETASNRKADIKVQNNDNVYGQLELKPTKNTLKNTTETEVNGNDAKMILKNTLASVQTNSVGGVNSKLYLNVDPNNNNPKTSIKLTGKNDKFEMIDDDGTWSEDKTITLQTHKNGVYLTKASLMANKISFNVRGDNYIQINKDEATTHNIKLNVLSNNGTVNNFGNSFTLDENSILNCYSKFNVKTGYVGSNAYSSEMTLEYNHFKLETAKDSHSDNLVTGLEIKKDDDNLFYDLRLDGYNRFINKNGTSVLASKDKIYISTQTNNVNAEATNANLFNSSRPYMSLTYGNAGGDIKISNNNTYRYINLKDDDNSLEIKNTINDYIKFTSGGINNGAPIGDHGILINSSDTETSKGGIKLEATGSNMLLNTNTISLSALRTNSDQTRINYNQATTYIKTKAVTKAVEGAYEIHLVNGDPGDNNGAFKTYSAGGSFKIFVGSTCMFEVNSNGVFFHGRHVNFGADTSNKNAYASGGYMYVGGYRVSVS